MTEDEKAFDNQRTHPRIAVNKNVKCKYEDDSLQTLMKDVSLGGAALIWPTSLEIGKVIVVQFSTELYFDAQVRWCRPSENHAEIGVQFIDLDEIAAIYFGEYIQSMEE